MLFGEALKAQIKRNLTKISCPQKKYAYISSLIGDRVILKKCKVMKDIVQTFPSKRLKYSNKPQSKKTNQVLSELKIAVKLFLEDEENTRMSPGKKDTITFKKKKRQK